VVQGDILKLVSNDFVPCDLVVLSTSEEDSACYIETADLDGETNLKKRYAPEATRPAINEARLAALNGGLRRPRTFRRQTMTPFCCGCFPGQVRCDIPNNKLEKFQGTLYLDEAVGLDNDNLVLRVGHQPLRVLCPTPVPAPLPQQQQSLAQRWLHLPAARAAASATPHSCMALPSTSAKTPS
jgi:hypothetical protein